MVLSIHHLQITRYALLIGFMFICTANTDQLIVTQLCSLSPSSSSSSICDCTDINQSPWGHRSLRISCDDRNLTFEQFHIENLPFRTEYLDLSWNQFNEIPNLYGKNLKYLKLSKNEIQKIFDRNFENVKNLRELDLSWNYIEMISMNAFDELERLQILDLSHNRLYKINLRQFSPLIALEDLNLSWNPKLNESTDLQELDFFTAFDLPLKLKTLKLGNCNLNDVILTHGINLQSLHLDSNNLTTFTNLPRSLRYLDLSNNPVERLQTHSLPHLFNLKILLMEDMPMLKSINEYSMFGLPSLQLLSFQNSHKLTDINPCVFGMILNETDVRLEAINLRGTGIRKLNSTLHLIFHNLKSLNLDGTPLLCDCDLRWIHEKLKIETDGHCAEPNHLRGLKLSKVTEEQFNCQTTPKWLSDLLDGLMILLLIVLCSGGLWLIVLGLKPKKVVCMRKIGATSPYAPVTIEPNRAE